MTGTENRIRQMMEDIKQVNSRESKDLLVELIGERLNKGLTNYNKEILTSFNVLYHKLGDPIRYIRKIIK